jgi:hypothetical protein
MIGGAARRARARARPLSAGLAPGRLVAWSGGAVVLGAVTALVLAPPGDFSARAPEALVELFARGRSRILLALYLSGLAWCGAFLVFAAALQHGLRARSDETTRLLGSIGLAGAVANSCAIGVLLVLIGLAAFRAEEGAHARFLPLLTDAAALANVFTGFATAVCIGGFAPALRRVGFPRWLLALGAAVGVHHLSSAGALATRGSFSPTGWIAASAPLGMALWVGCVAALAWPRRDRL